MDEQHTRHPGDGRDRTMQLMKDMRLDVYGKEVFAFTPKGDLFRLGAGATVLDFAFHIHSNVGSHCTGAVVNGQHRKITYRINSGDTVEILTSSNRTPKSDWLNIVVSTKAETKSSKASTRRCNASRPGEGNT